MGVTVMRTVSTAMIVEIRATEWICVRIAGERVRRRGGEREKRRKRG